MEWIESLPDRPVAPTKSANDLLPLFGGVLPDHPTDPVDVVDELATLAEPGIMAMSSGRFFGWVIGGTLPAALGADWLVSAWDQNAAMRYASPATAAIEETAGRWIVELLGLPTRSDVGFTTGGTAANFVGITAGRGWVLEQAGWDINAQGFNGAPRITVLAGAERHISVDLALRYSGLGLPTLVDADDQGRIIPSALASALDDVDGPVIVCLQAGNLHSGAFDPMRECSDLAHAKNAWVHVDGAFGLWAAASPQFVDALDGVDLADSWATDAHKTLNVPYDCGVAIVSKKDAAVKAFGVQASYLTRDGAMTDPMEVTPEMSRRARGVPVWAALRQLGRTGVVDMIDRLAENARALASGLGALGGVTVLNDVVFTQVSLSFGADERTREVTARLISDGTVWMSGSKWNGHDILRISVSNWSTDAAEVAIAIAAVKRAIAAVGIEPD
ncbi:pyridoxal-dependent decarboxylase [Glaciihabitans sp. UYNi722]|uniref:pyridoxal phosphate-dependent decarboxylase family protein n=1 Tax=Glaciihabitans sp. UYNi722 TaxID=3156344 RepID=UPI0033957FF8